MARALGGLPLVDAALSKGLLSYSKVRAMTRVATPDNEEKIVRFAKTATAAQLERICRSAARLKKDGRPIGEAQRWVMQRPGDGDMVRIEAQLHPDEAALVMRALDEIRRKAQPAAENVSAETPPPAHASPAPTENVSAETSGATRPPPRFGRADALVKAADMLLLGGGAAEPRRSGGDRVTVVVHLKENDLLAKPTVELDDGTRVSAETFRRIVCDAGMVPVVRDAEGNPLDIGRRTRAIPPAIRRALLLRDGTCAFPGCDCTQWLDAHHLEHWLEGGETKLENLLLLCPFHHRLIHEGGFSVALDRDRRPHFRDPDGRRIALTPPLPLVNDRALCTLRAANENAGARIDDQTCKSEWRGERVETGYVASLLL